MSTLALLCSKLVMPSNLSYILCLFSFVIMSCIFCFFFFQAEDGIRDYKVTGVQTCALPIFQDVARHGRPVYSHSVFRWDAGGYLYTRRLMLPLTEGGDKVTIAMTGQTFVEIGRASCRERV